MRQREDGDYEVIIDVDLAQIPDLHYPHPTDAYSLGETLEVIDAEVDYKWEGIGEVIDMFLKREGVYGGGAVMDLANEIDNSDFMATEWELEYDAEYPDTYEITAQTGMYDVDWTPLFNEIEMELTMQTVQQTAPSEVIVPGFGTVAELTPITGEREGQSGIVGWTFSSLITDVSTEVSSVDAIKTLTKRSVAMAILDSTLGMNPSREFKIALRKALAENTIAYVADESPLPTMNVLAGTDADGEGHLRIELIVDADDGDATALFFKEMVEDNDDEDEIIDFAVKAAILALQVTVVDASMTESMDSLKQHFGKFKGLF